MSRRQRGQAIVLIALTLGVLCGMTGLAIDLGRGFVVKREIQNASDASADAGYWTYVRSIGSPSGAVVANAFPLAEQAMLATYEVNRELSQDSCSPGWGAPAFGGSISIDCTFGSDSSQALNIAVESVVPGSGSDPYLVFQSSGRQQIATALVQIVGTANSFNDAAVGAVPFRAVGLPPCVGSCSGLPPPPSCSAHCTIVLPVVLAVDTSCGSGPDALAIHGSDSGAAVVGNVVSDGNLVTSGSNGPVAGDTSYYCGGTPTVTKWCYYTPSQPPCGAGQTLGALVNGARPPAFVIPTYPATANVPATTNDLQVNLSAGTFSSTTGLPYVSFGGPAGHTNGCWFLAGGTYTYGSSLSVASGVFSNELRPPDEPVPGSISNVQSPQFWRRCAGSFQLTPILDLPGPGLPVGAFGLPLPAGIYAVRLTSVRADNGVTRESAPSACRTLTLSSPTAVEIAISNVPGAQAYNVYVSAVGINGGTGTCAGPFFNLLQVPVSNYVSETDADVSGCPSTTTSSNCTLGVTVGAYDQCEIDQVNALLNNVQNPALPAGCPPPSLPALPEPKAPTCTVPSPPAVPPLPSGSPPAPTPPPLPEPPSCSWPTASFHELLAPAGSGLPDQDPAVGQEFANWGLCALPYSNTTANTLTTCQNGAGGYNPNALQTPGGVQLQQPSGGCVYFASSADPYLFSGYQFSWGVVVDPTAATCGGDAFPVNNTDAFNPGVGGEFVGHIYAPAANVQITSTEPYTPSPLEAPVVYGCVTGYTVDLEVAAGLAVYFVPPPYNVSGYGIPSGSPGPGC